MISGEHSERLGNNLKVMASAHAEGRLVGIAYTAIIRDGEDDTCSGVSGFTIDPEKLEAAASILGILTSICSLVSGVVIKTMSASTAAEEGEETTSGDQ